MMALAAIHVPNPVDRVSALTVSPRAICYKSATLSKRSFPPDYCRVAASHKFFSLGDHFNNLKSRVYIVQRHETVLYGCGIGFWAARIMASRLQ